MAEWNPYCLSSTTQYTKVGTTGPVSSCKYFIRRSFSAWWRPWGRFGGENEWSPWFVRQYSYERSTGRNQGIIFFDFENRDEFSDLIPASTSIKILLDANSPNESAHSAAQIPTSGWTLERPGTMKKFNPEDANRVKWLRTSEEKFYLHDFLHGIVDMLALDGRNYMNDSLLEFPQLEPHGPL